MRYAFLFYFGLFTSSLLAQADTIYIPLGQRFDVDPVEKATVRLNEMSAKSAFENRLQKQIQFFPDELENQQVVPGWGNCFVSAIHTSFDEHRPLSLTPDAIWLTICQGVSIHINQNFEKLESFIFKAEKPDGFHVRNDGLSAKSGSEFTGSSRDEHWADLLHAFSDSTTKYVNDDYYAFFVPEFSTSTNIITTSYEITMLEGFSQAFQYFGDSGCGIPYITLQGTREDWQSIYDRLDKIDELGLSVWATELRGVLQQFIDTFDGNVDLDFWQSIYKDHSEYGAWYVSGWFIKFFPYLETTGEIEEANDPEGMYYSRAPRIYTPNEFIKGDDYLISRLSTSDFPSGIAEIDVIWDDYGTERKMKVHAGFYGIKQYDDLTLEPAISWAIRDKSGEDADHDYERTNIETKHRHSYWSPHAIEELQAVAIYDPSSFSSAEKSYTFVKEYIINYVESNSYFSEENLIGKSLELLISSKGTILNCTGTGFEPELMSTIEAGVRLLPKKWSPAKSDYRNFIYEGYDPEDTGEIILIESNSLIRLEF